MSIIRGGYDVALRGKRVVCDLVAHYINGMEGQKGHGPQCDEVKLHFGYFLYSIGKSGKEVSFSTIF